MMTFEDTFSLARADMSGSEIIYIHYRVFDFGFSGADIDIRNKMARKQCERVLF